MVWERSPQPLGALEVGRYESQLKKLMHRAGQRCFELLDYAFSSHQQPSAYLTKGIPQLDKLFGQIRQTLRACTVAEAL